MGECEVQKAELKEALVLKFDGINFGVIDLEKARALRDELDSYFDHADGTITIKHQAGLGPIPRAAPTLKIKMDGDGPAELQSVSYDPLSDQSEFVFTF